MFWVIGGKKGISIWKCHVQPKPRILAVPSLLFLPLSPKKISFTHFKKKFGKRVSHNQDEFCGSPSVICPSSVSWPTMAHETVTKEHRYPLPLIRSESYVSSTSGAGFAFSSPDRIFNKYIKTKQRWTIRNKLCLWNQHSLSTTLVFPV